MSRYVNSASPLRRLNQPNGRARTRIGLRQRRSLTLVRMRRTRTCCGLPSGIQGVEVPRLLHPEIMRPQQILRDGRARQTARAEAVSRGPVKTATSSSSSTTLRRSPSTC